MEHHVEDPNPGSAAATAEEKSALPESAPPESAPPLWKRALGTAGGFVLGAVLLVAAWAKMLDPAAFAHQITNEGLDFLLPATAVALIALALEVGLGTALVLGARTRWVLWPSVALVIFFVFLTGRAYWRDLQGIVSEEASCGCFGNLVERTPAEAFWQDLLLLVPPLLLAFLGRRAAFPSRRLAFAGLLAIATILIAWKAPDLPLDNLATRLKPGIDPLALCAGADTRRVCLSEVVPELAEGTHVVVLADLDEDFGAHVEALNEYHWDGTGPTLWIVTSASEEEKVEFQFTWGPAFETREAPPTLLRPLYRTLPRSFLVEEGRVRETWSGLAPLDEL